MAGHPRLKTPIKALGDRVVVIPDEPISKSEGGILLPEVSQKKPAKGVVYCTGPGQRNESALADEASAYVPMIVKPGDRVIYGKYAGTDLEIDGVDVVILNEGDILLVYG